MDIAKLIEAKAGPYPGVWRFVWRPPMFNVIAQNHALVAMSTDEEAARIICQDHNIMLLKGLEMPPDEPLDE